MALERSSIARCAAGMVLAASILAHVQENGATTNSGYAPVDGLKMYYEIHGKGQPLILIHGGVGSTDMFHDIMAELSKGRKVIAVDLQAHGRTADIDRPMSFEAMADDIAALIHYLRIQKADVMGYSMGGVVALRTAIEHPEVVRKLVIVSAPYKRDGWYSEIVAGMSHLNATTAKQMEQTPMYQSYARLAPRSEGWPVLCTKLGVMASQDYDWSSEVAKMKVPVLIMLGDADAVHCWHPSAPAAPIQSHLRSA
jgi:pimeloyl-ACP methyl ester carboxylesterase